MPTILDNIETPFLERMGTGKGRETEDEMEDGLT